MTRTLAQAAAELLLEHGPLPLPDLHALALERGLTKAKKPQTFSGHLRPPDVVLRPDGRYDTAARLLRGQVFTARAPRVSGDGVLWTRRDLDALLVLPALPLATGGEVARGAGTAECWAGPPGWLPAASPGQLVALRWTGTAVEVSVLDRVPVDEPAVQQVREVLARHALGPRPYLGYYGSSGRTVSDLTCTVVGALVEDPTLFAQPLPPLSELLPLPEDLRPQDHLGADRSRVGATLLHVPVPDRVAGELGRRADLLGERLPDYLSMLLSAAADRLQPPAYQVRSQQVYDDDDSGYAEPYSGDGVVRLDQWRR